MNAENLLMLRIEKKMRPYYMSRPREEPVRTCPPTPYGRPRIMYARVLVSTANFQCPIAK